LAAPGRRPTAAQLDAITVTILNYDRNSIEVAASPGTHEREVPTDRWIAGNDWSQRRLLLWAQKPALTQSAGRLLRGQEATCGLWSRHRSTPAASSKLGDQFYQDLTQPRMRWIVIVGSVPEQ